MSDMSSITREELTAEEELLAGFLQEIERSGPDGVDLSAWIVRAPQLAARLRKILEMQRALEGTRPVAEPPPPSRLGEFRIVRWVGGHLGAVYEAVQEPLGRRVAVKTIRQGRFTPELQARFLREQQVLASLHQTHIVPIFTAGVDGPLQYFAMPYINGAALHHVVQALGELQSSHPGSQTPGLKDLARIATKDAGGADVSTVTRVGAIQISQPQPPPISDQTRVRVSLEYARSVARVMADVAVAIQHAHDQQILHRDIKPSNIMVDTQEQCWIIDFGLARYVEQTAAIANHANGNGVPVTVATPRTGSESSTLAARVPVPGEPQSGDAALTIAGGLLGTPSYMAPEQFGGTADTRTDVWGLGATLYELLTLRRPFSGADVTALKQAVREQPPAAPRTLAEGVPADLEAICLKAMEKSPDRRYQTAAEFSDDLRRWLGTEPTRARPARTLRRVAMWSRRNPGWAAAMALCIVAFTALWTVQDARTRSELTTAAAVRESELRRAAAVRELELAQTAALRESALQESQSLRLLSPRSGWSATGLGLIATAAQAERDSRLSNAAAACLAGTDAEIVKDWNFRSSSVEFSRDGKRVLIGGGIDGNTRIWHAESDSFSESQQSGFGPVGFASNDDGLQWAAESPWTFVLWNVSKQEQVCRVQAPLPAGIEAPTDPELIVRLMYRVSLGMSRDTQLLAASVPYPDDQGSWTEGHGATCVWNDQGELMRTIDEAGSALCFSPDNALLAVGRQTGEIDVVDLQLDQPVISLRGSVNEIHALDFMADRVRHDDGSHWLLAAGDAGSVVRIWDVEARNSRSICRGSAYDVYAVRFSPDGMTLASGGREGARLWDIWTGEPLLHLIGTADYITGLAFSADGARLAVSAQGPPGHDLHTTNIWAIQRGRGIGLLQGLSSQIVHTCLSSDGRLLTILAQNWEIAVYDTSPPRLRHILQGPVGFTADNSALAISTDNRSLAMSTGSEARIWNLETGNVVARLALPPALVDQLAYTPDGKLLSFRSECQDGRTAPMSDAHPRIHPRVLRLRNLLADDPLQPLAEIPRFNWHVFCAVAHPQGEFFIAEGLHVSPDSKSQEIIAFDGATGAEVWKHVPAVPNESPMLILDPTGSTLSDFDPSQKRTVQWRVPSGELLPQLSPKPLALGPFGDFSITDGPVKFDGTTGPGFALWRRDGNEPTAVLGIDFLVHQLSPHFSRDGRLLVFGTRNGQVAMCDLPEIERRLAEFTKGPLE